MIRAVRQFTVCMGDIEGEGTKAADILTDTHQYRFIFIRELCPGIHGDIPCQTGKQGCLDKLRFILVAVTAAEFPAITSYFTRPSRWSTGSVE